MTTSTYYDMCEQLGTEIVEIDVPVSYDDLCNQSQHALNLFEYLVDKWDTMNGSYLGKDFSNIESLFGLLGILIYDRLIILDLVRYITNYRINSVNKKLKNKVNKR